ncbi:hypothetical protein HELRODRAFT_159591 [Helobdella robusta]|uniref:Uncharacterized protein n=1 Tax=Helobdella robusta TaxID=6412 RepID=T1EP76_HELRO|nr:hypothetical protein HELRODRAFT_159591 [Helobdella robusta]ESO12997.1 hypothetical protein HELRODRAFT_159591 [Helobdella robusta]
MSQVAPSSSIAVKSQQTSQKFPSSAQKLQTYPTSSADNLNNQSKLKKKGGKKTEDRLKKAVGRVLIALTFKRKPTAVHAAEADDSKSGVLNKSFTKTQSIDQSGTGGYDDVRVSKPDDEDHGDEEDDIISEDEDLTQFNSWNKNANLSTRQAHYFQSREYSEGNETLEGGDAFVCESRKKQAATSRDGLVDGLVWWMCGRSICTCIKLVVASCGRRDQVLGKIQKMPVAIIPFK